MPDKPARLDVFGKVQIATVPVSSALFHWLIFAPAVLTKPTKFHQASPIENMPAISARKFPNTSFICCLPFQVTQ